MKKHPGQFYPTPPDAVRALIKAAKLKPGMTVLEPSAGTGALIEPALRAKCRALAIEEDGERFNWLRYHYQASKSLVVWRADFLCCTFPVTRKFDRVLMNPPFNPDLDTRHVLHAWDFCLARGGVLVAVITPRFLRARGGEAERLRLLVKTHGSVTRLPDNHRPGATRITVLLKLTKP